MLLKVVLLCHHIGIVTQRVHARLFPFANDLYLFLSEPLMRHLPETSSMIATEVASPFLTPFKLTLSTAIMIAVPYLLYQLWAFVAPGLYDHERKLVFPLLFASTLRPGFNPWVSMCR